MNERIHTCNELAAKVATDPELQAKIKADPVQAITELAAPLQTDVWVYRMVIGALGLAVLFSIIGAVVLAGMDNKDIPDGVVALGSAAVGALAGLLVPSPTSM